MIKKLRTKFVIVIMSIVTIMLIGILSVVFLSTESRLDHQSNEMMHNLAMNPMLVERPEVKSDNIRLPFFTLQRGRNGELIARGGGYYDLSDEEFLQQLMDTVDNLGVRTGILDEYNLKFLSEHTPDGRDILVFSDISSSSNALNSLLKTCSLVFLLAFFVFLFISIMLARWIVKPVENAWARQNRFLADASHELKTPLTVITTDSEMIASGEFSQVVNSKLISDIQAMAGQMRGLVDEMLQLAKIEASGENTGLSRLDFSALAAGSSSQFEPVFFEKGLALKTEIEDGIFVKGSESQLRQAVDVLLDNACKYSAGGSETILKLRHAGKACILSVTNSGEGIPPDKLDAVFERFYRVDEARSMNGSYGLGLAIAKEAVENSGGKIWVESFGGVTTFYIQIPAA